MVGDDEAEVILRRVETAFLYSESLNVLIHKLLLLFSSPSRPLQIGRDDALTLLRNYGVTFHEISSHETELLLVRLKVRSRLLPISQGARGCGVRDRPRLACRHMSSI